MKPELFIADIDGSPEYAEGYPMPIECDFSRIETCPLCGRAVSGGYWPQPREVILTKRKVPDFLYTLASEANFVISERALDVIREAGLRGITCAQEIEVTRFQRKGKDIPIPKYYHIEIVRSKMTIDHEKSVIVYGNQEKGSYAQPCPLCRPVPGTYDFLRHLEFHTEEYEGYDIFHTYELCSATFLSKRFVDVCQENGLTNLCYEPAAKHGARLAAYFLDGDENA